MSIQGMIIDQPSADEKRDHPPRDPAGIDLLLLGLDLRLLRSGETLPWLGPALRGIVAQQLKQQACRHDPIEREERWTYCTGCPFNESCTYGQLFEPDIGGDQPPLPGAAEAQRRVVLDVNFPTPSLGMRGDRLRVTAKVLGRDCGRLADALLEALRVAGANRGIGPDHVAFEVADLSTWPLRLDASTLPRSPDETPSLLPIVKVRLTSPLFLRQRLDDTTHPVRRPTFEQLFSASMRTVSQALLLHGIPLHADFAALKHAAAKVTPWVERWKPFSQRRWSNRRLERFTAEGCTGEGWFRDVPLSLLPWLYWGGMLHVGMHRVAGAGGWRVELA